MANQEPGSLQDDSEPTNNQEAEQVRPDSPSRVPLWLSTFGILIGLVLVGFLVFGAQFFDNSPYMGLNEYRLTLCIGFGLILTGFGTRAAGTWKSWSVAGSGAAAVMLYLLLWQTAEEPKQSIEDPAIVARVEGGFHPATKVVQVEAPNSEKLYTSWHRVAQTLKVRIEKRHLDTGCIGFVEFVPTDDGSDLVDMTTYIPVGFFKKLFKKELHKAAEHLALGYDTATNTLFQDAQKQNPISHSTCPIGRATGAMPVRDVSSLLQKTFALIFPVARAQNKELIDNLSSDNALVRREARQLLAKEGVDAIAPVMAALDASPASYRLQIGALVMLSEMLRSTDMEKEIRAKLTDENIQRLAKLVAYNDETMRQSATKTMTLLADPRAVETLFGVIEENPNSDGAVNAAKVIVRTYGEFDDQTRQTIVSKWQANPPPAGTPVHDEWQTLSKFVNKQNSAPSKVWAYVGINFGNVWDEKYFKWKDDNDHIPAKGDVLTATGSVNLRKDRIRFSFGEGWINSPIVGLIQPGEKIRVENTQVVAGGFYWIEGELVK